MLLVPKRSRTNLEGAKVDIYAPDEEYLDRIVVYGLWLKVGELVVVCNINPGWSTFNKDLEKHC